MKHPRELLLLAIIVLAALFFRTYQLDVIPPGLFPDEAYNGNNAVEALRTGAWKIFYPENFGREGLFINIQALSVATFGNTTWALRIVSAIIGTLTVLGVYLLGRKVFNWQIGAIASFLLAVSFWHTLFSRIGFRAIMAPFFVVWGMYFFWRGLTSAKISNFVLSGLAWGLGMYTYIGFRAMPLALVLTLLAYWHSTKKDFDITKYLHTRTELIRGFAALMLTALIVFIPLGLHFYTHPEDFLGRTSQISIFDSKNPLLTLGINAIKTLGMFTFVGDFNSRHNLPGEAMLFWPVGVFFLIGIVRSVYKLRKSYKRHGHFSTAQTMLLSWFGAGLLPVIFSNEGLPHALRAIIVIPVTYLFAAEGMWWLFEAIEKWYRYRDLHFVKNTIPVKHRPVHEGAIVATLVTVMLLGSVAAYEFHKYFSVWAPAENTKSSFHYADWKLAERINELDRLTPKYIVVDLPTAPDAWTWVTQSIMFLTDSQTPEQQSKNNIYYITPQQLADGQRPAGEVFYLK